MEEILFIDKSRTLLKDQDFDFLRAKGLEYIEDLSSKLWTDYNAHDPGITILEALSFAITELGYRTSFDIKDLMADKDGNIGINQAFFSAKNILSTNPLTIEDYRKLLVDIIGIRNAWLYPYRDEDTQLIGEPEQEVPIFAHCKKDQLVYEKTDHPVKLHGLYKVLLDLEETDEFGDLNSGNITWQFSHEDLIDLKLQLILPNWKGNNTFNYEFITNADPETISGINVTLANNQWNISFDITASGDTKAFNLQALVLLKKDISSFASVITDQFNNASQLIEIFKTYQKKIQLIVNILNTAKKTLHANRNLTEDFIQIETICTQEVAFCADIEVKPDADIEEVYAKVLFQIENYLNPEVNFYTLKELIDEGVPTEEIFEGPSLSHGFIKTDELKKTQVRSKIFVSDIINFIMDTEGVLTVKNVLLTKYDSDGKPVLPSDRWCMTIKEGCKPILNILKSKVLFFKGKLPFKAKLDETMDSLKYFHGLEQRKKLKGTTDDLEFPKGNYYDLQDYLSVQYEFPTTYGIGSTGLTSSAPNERKAQAKQLKAYLLFFDQLLGNFFSQLSNAKTLFTLDPSIKQTYFGQYLKDTSGVEEIYSSPTDVEKVFSPPLPGDSDTIKKLRALLLEDADTMYDRRNRFLDHMLARFSETFNEYVLMLYSYKNASDYEDIGPEELIKDKILFLKDYPIISRDRGKAFNYLKPSWDSDNVAGLEKRIARLSGIDNYFRRFLFCIRHIEIQKTNTNPAKYFFKVIDESGNLGIESIKEYDSFTELQTIISKLSKVMEDSSFYHHQDISATEFSFEIVDSSNTPIAKSGEIFSEANARNTAIEEIVNKMKAPCPEEGMHLVEHILLRPRFTPPVIPGMKAEDVYQLFHVCLGENCDFCGEEDPYSFRLSLILPYWHDRFKSMEFRRYFENLARTETPAHCMIKICWVDNTSMNEFERSYKEWLIALALYETDLIQKDINKERLRLANNAMIDILKKLHSEYPEAHLHDCDTGVSNPVLLGNTVLGTYKF